MSDWRARHPFTVGQKVYPRPGGRAYPLVAVPAATIVSLSAWLIWSLLT
jgi:hypothetical protein